MKTTLSTLLLAGATVLSAAPAAFAGADDGGTKAFWSDQAQPRAAAPRSGTRRNDEQYRATYVAPRATDQSQAAKPEKDPPYFYHAQGTMGVP